MDLAIYYFTANMVNDSDKTNSVTANAMGINITKGAQKFQN